MFTPDDFDTLIDEPGHCNGNDTSYREVERPHDLTEVFPILAQLETSVS